MPQPVLTLPIADEDDLLIARRRARDLAGFLDLPGDVQTRVAGAVAQVGRAAAAEGGGELVLGVLTAPRELVATVSGVPFAAFDGSAGALDLRALRRIADRVEIAPYGPAPAVRLGWSLDPLGFSPDLPALRTALAERGALADEARTARVDELQRENTELVAALAAVREREQAVGLLVAELEQQARDLQAGLRERTRALRHLAHELRTPLYATRSLVEAVVADTPGLGAPLADDLALVDRAVGEALDLIDDQLDLARLGAGRTRVHLRDVDLGELLQTLRVVAAHLPRTPGVRLVVEDPPVLPATLRTDGPKLSQILRNLLANALKFTAAGEVRVTSAPTPDGVRVTVADTGPGLTAGEAVTAFEEFGQAGGDAAEAVMRGTGLGLPLSRGLAEVLGGRLDLRSGSGEGSAFTVTVPLRHPGPSDGVELVEG